MQRLRFPALALITASALMPILFCALPRKDYSATERRYLEEPPAVTAEGLLRGELSEKFEDYLADHFPGRNLFVGVNAYWNLLTGRNAAGEVCHCADDFLIAAPKSCTTEQLTTNLERFDRFAERMNLPATLLMIPTAGDVVTDVLPKVHAPYHFGECLPLAQSFPHLRVPDLGAALSAQYAGDGEAPYYRTDHHLTSAGCYMVYQAFCESRGTQPLPREAYTVSRYDGFHGSAWTSSGYWLTPSETLETWDSGAPLRVTIEEAGKEPVIADSPFFTENLRSDDMYTVFLDGNHALVRIENPDAAGKGKLLLVRDSYGHCLAPFLASEYEEIILVDLRYYRWPVSALVEQYGITELGFACGLDNLLTDTNSAWLD